jgi:predicted O-linked N-acetylglucosamine transferase (SPINDLY family)
MSSTGNSKQASLNQQLNDARKHHKNGELDLAASAYELILKSDPQNADACYLSGLVEYRLGRSAVAKELIIRALRFSPSHALALASLAQILLDEDDFNSAKQLFLKADALKPNSQSIANGLGLALMKLGELTASREVFSKALSLHSSDFYLRFNLAKLEYSAGNLTQALHHYQLCLKLKSNDAAVYNSIGAVLFSQRKIDHALAAFERVIELQPVSAEAHNNIGAIYIQRKQYELALQQFSCALQLWSGFEQAHVNAGLAHQLLGQPELAKHMLNLAMRISDTEEVLPRLAFCFLDLRQIYTSGEQLVESRQLYKKALSDFHKFSLALDSNRRENLQALIGFTQPFYLPYQGCNDRDLQVLYGGCLSFKKHRDREISELVRPGQGRLRVGIVSAFFYDHSNWKIPIRGWMQALGERVEIIAYYTGAKTDRCTDDARSLAGAFHQNLGFDEICRQIEVDKIDVLIYPEIGMDQLTARLASHRLAAVQCASWGHPVTSGLSSIDYFLSSDLMEPENAQQWYSERLVRLPGLSFTWDDTKPKPNATVFSRNDFALKDKDAVFLCVQNSSKYLPQFDQIFAQIALQVPSAKFVFIDPENDALRQILVTRFTQAFAACGLDMTSHIVFLNRLGSDRFRGLNCIADVCLDTPLWSGCNSSLEAISADLPIVTWPGDSMRSRHTSAIYQTIGISELTVSDQQSYVDLAVRLVNDQQWNGQVRGKIAAQKYQLALGQKELGQALSDFFVNATKQQ